MNHKSLTGHVQSQIMRKYSPSFYIIGNKETKKPKQLQIDCSCYF